MKKYFYWINVLLCILTSTLIYAQQVPSFNSPEEMAAYRLKSAKEAAQQAQEKSAASIQIEKNYTAEELVRDIFIGGGCFDVSNVKFTGSADAKGYFSNGNSSINIGDGVILASGDVNNAVGPNGSNSRSTAFNNESNDYDLLASVDNFTDEIWDQVTLEFDFVPTTDFVSFEYAFASEEYCEFAGDNYNDVFGFYISGPGIWGPFSNSAQNIALIPGTNDFVSINSVNHYINEEYYVPNESVWGALSCGKPHEPHAFNDIEYDGMTKVLTASATVIPCETYHIKLTLGDGEDAVYDSAVFLKANSFSAGGSALVSAASPVTGSNTVYESCNDGYFLFERTSENNILEPIEVNFIISPESTATEGLDFAPLPSSITIPKAEMSVLLPVDVLTDNIIENNETLIIEVDNSCSCSTTNTEMVIIESQALEVQSDIITLCENTVLEIDPATTGGISALSFEWSNGSLDSTLSVNTILEQDYSVTVTDLCGSTAVAFYQIDLLEAPSASIGGIQYICDDNASSEIPITIQGSGPWEITYSLNGVIQSPTTINTLPVSLPTNEAGIYELISVNNDACDGIASGMTQVLVSEINVEAQIEAADCYNDGLGSINVTPISGSAPFSYDWGDPSFASNLIDTAPAGDYSLTITDNVGCTETASFIVEDFVVSPLATIDPPLTITCNNPVIQLDGSKSDSGQDYSFTWTTPDGNIVSGASTLFPAVDQEGLYNLVVQNMENGCSSSTSTLVDINVTLPQSAPTTPDELTCITTEINLGIQSSGATGIAYEWSTTDGNILNGFTTNSPLVNAAGTYTLVSTNIENGCSTSNEVEVSQNIVYPEVAIAQVEELNCTIQEVDLIPSISNVDNYAFEWQFNNTTFTNQIINPIADEAGVYTLQLTNTENGCSTTTMMEVTQNEDLPEAMLIDRVVPICKGDMGAIRIASIEGGVPPYLYSVDGGDSFYGEETFTALEAGIYEIAIQDANGCELTEIIDIPDGNQPVVSLDPLIELELGDEHRILTNVNLLPSQIESIQWYPETGLSCSDCLDPMVLPTSNTMYEIQIMDENGCMASAQIEFRVEFDSGVYVPNAFSPHNKDGVNDQFQIFAKRNVVTEIKEFSIFDRWGTQLYTIRNIPATDTNYGWNGIYDNKQMLPGVYVYSIQVELLDGSVVSLSGDVTLVN